MTIATLLQRLAWVDLRQPAQYTPCGLPCSERHPELGRVGWADVFEGRLWWYPAMVV